MCLRGKNTQNIKWHVDTRVYDQISFWVYVKLEVDKIPCTIATYRSEKFPFIVSLFPLMHLWSSVISVDTRCSSNRNGSYMFTKVLYHRMCKHTIMDDLTTYASILISDDYLQLLSYVIRRHSFITGTFLTIHLWWSKFLHVINSVWAAAALSSCTKRLCMNHIHRPHGRGLAAL